MSVDGNNIDLNVTSNPNLAPPGWYMLFAVDANGVPSVAKWVHLQGPSASAQASERQPPRRTSTTSRTPRRARSRGPAGSAPRRRSAPPSPAATGTTAPSTSACPTAFPDEVKKTTAARCAWLKKNDYGRLKVNGKDDPLGLDPSKDGLACGTKDLRRR